MNSALSDPRTSTLQEQAIVDFLLTNVNFVRTSNGLPPYALNASLSQAGQSHSEDMARQAFALFEQGQNPIEAVQHTGSDGTRAANRVAATGYQAIQVGENIYGGIFGVQAALDFWLGSSAHLNNILHERYREVGIGAAPGPEGLVMYTVVFAHSPTSPIMPAPTSIPISALPSVTNTSIAAPAASATQPATPRPTSTIHQVQLPHPIATVTISPTSTPVDSGPSGQFAWSLAPWVLLVGVGLAAGIYRLVRLRR